MNNKKKIKKENKKAKYRSLREQNIGLILKKVIEKKNVTRVQIARETGLPKSTISDLVNYLILKEVLYEEKKAESKIGKKPIILKLNEDLIYMLILDIHYEKLEAAIANLKGKIIHSKKEEKFPGRNRAESINYIFNLIDDLLEKSNKISKKVKIISVGTHGIVDPKSNKIIKAPYIKDWSGINLVDILEDKYGFDVIVNNSVNLGAIGEQWVYYKDIKDLVYIDIESGVGAGIIINGDIVDGKNGAMGEISYLPITKNYDNKKLQQNTMDLGLFESQVDIHGITKAVNEALRKSKSIQNFEDLNFQEISRNYRDNKNKVIKKVIDDQIIKILSIGIASIISIIDTELIIINGNVLLLGESFLKKLTKEIYCITPFNVKIVASKLKENAHIVGAIKYGLNHINKIFYQNFYQVMDWMPKYL